MTEHAPLIIATLGTVIALLYLGLLRPYIEAKKDAAETERRRNAFDAALAILDNAVGVAVLATEQTIPKLPATGDTTQDAKAAMQRSAEKLAKAIRLVERSVDIAAIEAALGIKVSIPTRIEAAVNQLKRGKL